MATAPVAEFHFAKFVAKTEGLKVTHVGDMGGVHEKTYKAKTNSWFSFFTLGMFE